MAKINDWFDNPQGLPALDGEQLVKAIEHLTASLELTGKTRDSLCQGVLDMENAPGDLAKAWYEINCCRKYTESIVMLEEYLQPAMGLINDARCMMESLVQSGSSLTRSALSNMIDCLYQAEEYVHATLEELETWLSSALNDGAEGSH